MSSKMKNGSFGYKILHLNLIIEGLFAGYAYTNRSLSDEMLDFINNFKKHLISLLDTNDADSRNFLEICVDNMESIANQDLRFLSKFSCMNNS